MPIAMNPIAPGPSLPALPTLPRLIGPPQGLNPQPNGLLPVPGQPATTAYHQTLANQANTLIESTPSGTSSSSSSGAQPASTIKVPGNPALTAYSQTVANQGAVLLNGTAGTYNQGSSGGAQAATTLNVPGNPALSAYSQTVANQGAVLLNSTAGVATAPSAPPVDLNELHATPSPFLTNPNANPLASFGAGVNVSSSA